MLLDPLIGVAIHLVVEVVEEREVLPLIPDCLRLLLWHGVIGRELKVDGRLALYGYVVFMIGSETSYYSRCSTLGGLAFPKNIFRRQHNDSPVIKNKIISAVKIPFRAQL